MQTIQLTWNGETVELKPSFDLFMRIEEKVAFNRIADAFNRAGQGNVADLPMSHVAWAMYCTLRHAGVPVRTPLDVHQAIFDGRFPDYGAVIGQLIVAYYGAAPEKPVKKKAEQPSQPRRSARTSKNATE
jgi:hypothetical protein